MKICYGMTVSKHATKLNYTFPSKGQAFLTAFILTIQNFKSVNRTKRVLK